MRPNIREIQLRYMRENGEERFDRPLLGVVPDYGESFEMLIKYPGRLRSGPHTAHRG